MSNKRKLYLRFDLECEIGFMFMTERKDIEVKVGQLVQGVVKSIDKTRKLLYMSSDPDTVSKCVVCL